MSYSIPYTHRNLRKLFVGQIPKSFTEEDVMNIFRDTCDVPLAHIIKDKVTLDDILEFKNKLNDYNAADEPI